MTDAELLQPSVVADEQKFYAAYPVRPPGHTRAEHSEKLRLLLGVKRSFLRLHFLNELSDPFIRQLVRYADHKGAVVIDLLVEFDALVTHSNWRE